jgi:hypothetical protein
MASTNPVTGDRITSKISQDKEAYGKGLEAIFGKRDFRNRPIQEPNDEGSVVEIKDEDKVGR